MTLFNDFKKTVLLFVSLASIAFGTVQAHLPSCAPGCRIPSRMGMGLDGEMNYGMGGMQMSASLQDTYALTMLLEKKASLEEKAEHEDGGECDHGPTVDREFNEAEIARLDKAIAFITEKEGGNYTPKEVKCVANYHKRKMELQAELDEAEKPHVHKAPKLSADANKKIIKSLQRKIDFLTDDLTLDKAILNGVGAGAFGKHFKASGNAKYDIITGAIGAMTEPAGLVIAEHGKAFWTRVGIYLSKKWNRISNIFFGTATFTTREVEAWKSEIKEVVKAFEDAFKRASGNASASHGLALRSGIFAAEAETPGCTDQACADAACGDNKKVVEEDPALKARKKYCQVQIANLLEEVDIHKKKSKEDKALCQRALLVEIALHALADCIARQTSLNELNSAAIFDEISVWRDLAVSALNSIITATDPLADVKLRATSGYSSYGGYGSSGYGSNSF